MCPRGKDERVVHDSEICELQVFNVVNDLDDPKRNNKVLGVDRFHL